LKFLDHMTLGQYIPVDSLVHRLDPRCKILGTVALMGALFVGDGAGAMGAWGGLFFLLASASKIPVSMALRGVRPVVILIAFTAVINLFFSSGEPLWSWGILRVSREGMVAAFTMSFRLFFLVLFAGFLTLTTSPMELADGLERLLSILKPIGFPAHEMAMMMTIALRFIPTLLDETDRILKAQLARGADLDRGGIGRRIKAFVPVLVPLFILVFQRAEDLATAMEARCYRGGDGRTRMHPLRWTLRDSGALVGLCLVTVFVCVLDARWPLLR